MPLSSHCLIPVRTDQFPCGFFRIVQDYKARPASPPRRAFSWELSKMADVTSEYRKLANELSDVVPEQALLRDFPKLFSSHGLRALRRTGGVRYVLGPRGEIAYPPTEA